MSGELLLYIGLYMVIQLVITMALGLFFGLRLAIIHQGRIDPLELQNIVDRHAVYMLSTSVLLSLFIYILLFRAKGESLMGRCKFRALGVKPAGLAVLLGLEFNFILAMANLLTSFYKLFPDHEKIMEQLIGGDFFLTIMVVGIMIPVFEEILFRGIVLNELRKYTPLAVAVVVQGLLFGLYHLNALQAIYASVLGIFAGMVYIWLNSLWAPILVHASFNLFSVIMSRIGDEEIVIRYGVAILAAGGLILGLTVYLLWRNRTSAKNDPIPVI